MLEWSQVSQWSGIQSRHSENKSQQMQRIPGPEIPDVYFWSKLNKWESMSQFILVLLTVATTIIKNSHHNLFSAEASWGGGEISLFCPSSQFDCEEKCMGFGFLSCNQKHSPGYMAVILFVCASSKWNFGSEVISSSTLVCEHSQIVFFFKFVQGLQTSHIFYEQ